MPLAVTRLFFFTDLLFHAFLSDGDYVSDYLRTAMSKTQCQIIRLAHDSRAKRSSLDTHELVLRFFVSLSLFLLSP